MRFAVIAVLLALGVAGASARPGPAVNVNEWAHDVVDALKGWSGDRVVGVEAGALDALERGEHQHEHKFTLLTKHIVRPSIAKSFVKEWLKVREEAVNATGSVVFSLSKPLTDNIIFYGYQAWESKADFFKWIKNSEEVKNLAKWIEEKDVALTLTQLIPIPEYHRHHSGHGKVQLHSQPLRAVMESASDAADTFKPADVSADNSVPQREGRDPTNAIVLTKFIVKPSELVKFVKASELITKAVRQEEKGSVVYGFSAELGNDYTVWNYAVWEDKEAVETHLKSCYAKKFLEFVLDNDVLTTTTILFPIESLDE